MCGRMFFDILLYSCKFRFLFFFLRFSAIGTKSRITQASLLKHSAAFFADLYFHGSPLPPLPISIPDIRIAYLMRKNKRSRSHRKRKTAVYETTAFFSCSYAKISLETYITPSCNSAGNAASFTISPSTTYSVFPTEILIENVSFTSPLSSCAAV